MPISAQLLVVSPDATVAQAMQECAVALGHSAFIASTLAAARRLLARVHVDLICLDSVLPARDVDRLCQAADDDCESVPPGRIFLAPSSAKLVPSALPASFRARRDGLVTKPLRVQELQREVARVLAEKPRLRDAELLRVGEVALDTAAHQLLFESGGAVALTPTEYRLLHYLMERPGELVSPDELLERAWGYPKDTGGAEVVRAHVSNVRRKLRAIGCDPQLVRNVPYQGYGVNVTAANANAADGRGRARHSK